MSDPATQDIESRLRTALSGQYRVEGLLGQGGMGAVFRAHDEALDRPVAIKVVSPDMAASAELRQRFVMESRTVARLRHPNIVAVYAAGESDGLLYFVMEFVPGESLRDRLTREGKISEADAVPILRDMGLALDYAHAAGVVHRDVKPENVLLDRETGRAMLTDFGVARALQSNVQLTGAGFVLGSPRYMSPEQAGGEQNIDGRSDLYSLGLIAVEMITGTPAVEATTAATVLIKHLTEQVPSLSVSAPGTSETVSHAVDLLLRKNPNERWARGRDFAAAVAGEPIPGTPPSPIPGASRGTTRVSAQTVGAKARRWIGGGVAALAAAAAGVFFLGNRGSSDDKEWIVAPFEVQSPDNSLDWLREGGLNMLTISLAQWKDLHVVEYERTLDLLRDEKLEDTRRVGLEDAQRLARRGGAGRVVLGQLTLAGDSVIATANLYDVRSGKVTDRARAAALRTADPRGLFQELAGELLDLVGGPRVSLDLAQQTTTSVEAYRLYLSGLRALNSWRLTQADSMFSQAIALDSTFALAYYRRSLGQGWMGRMDSSRLFDVDKSIQYASRLPTRQQEIVRGHGELTLGFVNMASGDRTASRNAFIQSRDRFAKLVVADSLDAEAWYALADADYHLVWNTNYGRNADSSAKYLNESLRAFQRTIRLDSTFHLAYQHLVDLYERAAIPRSFILVNDSIKAGGSEANERKVGGAERIASLRNAAGMRAREAAQGWISADPDAVQARTSLATNLEAAGMIDSAIKVLQGAMARPATNAAVLPWRILRIRARQLQPGVGQAYADLLSRTPVDSFAAMTIGERYSALTDVMAVAGLTGRLSLLTTASDLLTNTTVMLPTVQQTPTRVIAQWFALAIRGGTGVLQSAGERAQFAEIMRSLSQLPPEARDRVSPYVLYLSTRDSTFANLTIKTVAAMGDTVGYPELVAMLSLQRGDKATAERLARTFPSPDSLRKSTIGLTGLRIVTRAVVLAELGNTRRAVETLEAIDPARFQRNDGLDITWAVYVRQFALRGKLYEQLGDKAKAVEAYERFITLWQEAEDPLQPQLREAREAVARLRDAAVTRPG
ncbi:MAG TPA: serine/threonine-protein kinase [Gemmatimonas sp.]|uniref:serine/threonine-protein kinase n=1 Tax=Gemmatimonas sp. TaxID=1962908 RepID=UPI002EDAB554